MSVIRENLIVAAINKAYALTDYNIYNDLHEVNKFQKQVILADESLTKDEKSEAIKKLTKTYDRNKIIFNEGTRRVCENCNQKCLATLYCEFCVRNYLKAKFSNWSSGNEDIDNLIQECQMETTDPDSIIEWIPYSNLININYLAKGGYSEIYTSEWIHGKYDEWDSKEQQLKRLGEQDVAISHLNISNKVIVQCYGLTQDPLNGDYMLVMNRLDIDLRKYLQQNHTKLAWKERIQIAVDIIDALLRIHDENAIHRDLHSGNILFKTKFSISDLGFCGPADRPSKSIYGNLPYIAPEVIAGKETTLNLIFIPSKRPDINTLLDEIDKLNFHYQNNSNESTKLEENDRSETNSLENYTSNSKLFTSKVHQFENLSEPRNATEEEQQAFHSNKSCDFHIPNHIDDFGNLSNQNNNSSKISSKGPIASDFWRKSQEILNYSNSLLINFQEIMQQMKRNRINIDDEEDMYNNPNFHPEEQDEFELPENMDEN
ncbi:kinase-like protein [Rhizophagus irregularis]|uniref:Kinase-like protein n=1 Tax=Rhizophagus irregularis TaxID=588596 RepID=A0A2N1MQR7_9GLOM|nr:kinase-like protein [Rhizophagus irregularis]